MAKSLLEKAIASKNGQRTRRDYSDEELELVQAWLEDKIGLKAIQDVMSFKTSANVYPFLAIGARLILRREKNS